MSEEVFEEIGAEDVEVINETVEEEAEMKTKKSLIDKIKETFEAHPKVKKAAEAAGLATVGVIVGILGYKKLNGSENYIEATNVTDVMNEPVSLTTADDGEIKSVTDDSIVEEN